MDINSTIVFRDFISKTAAFDAINATVVHLIVKVILAYALAFADCAVATQTSVSEVVTAFVDGAIVDKHIYVRVAGKTPAAVAVDSHR